MARCGPRGRRGSLAQPDRKADGGAFVAIYLDVNEGRPADQLDATWGQEAPGDGDGLYGLVERPRADGLHLGL